MVMSLILTDIFEQITPKWVTKDVTLGRLYSYASDAAIIQNIATAKNDLRALDLKMKMP